MPTTDSIHPAFRQSQYLFRRKIFKLLGAAFHVYDAQGRLLLYSKQKAFKLKEDFRVYSDESGSEELLVIKTAQIWDIWATYHVQDGISGERLGALRRKALMSMFRDEWTFLSPAEQALGTLTEASWAGAVMSRLIKLIPQNYTVAAADGGEVANIYRHFNPFVLKYTMNIRGQDPPIDRRLLIAAGILLAGIERREK